MATITDWAACFKLLEKFDLNHILIASGTPAIHYMAKLHCDEIADIQVKKERTFGTGAGDGKTDEEIISEIKGINSARCEYWTDEIYIKNTSGESEKVSAFYGAAVGAGIRFGNHITTYSTFKVANILGLAKERNQSEIEKIIKNGGSLFVKDVSNYVICSNTSTYQGSNLILNHPSMLRTCDYISRDLRYKVRQKLQNTRTAPTAIQVKEIENWVLTNFLPGKESEGCLTEDFNSGTPAFSDVEFSITGDTFELHYTGIIPAPLLFGFITQKFVVPGFIN